MIGDCVYYCLSLIDASATGEPTEEGYYQEEEDYPGHFANQGKPSFESYPIPSFKITYLIVFKLNCIIELLE
jgi:hypothetical protein